MKNKRERGFIPLSFFCTFLYLGIDKMPADGQKILSHIAAVVKSFHQKIKNILSSPIPKKHTLQEPRPTGYLACGGLTLGPLYVCSGFQFCYLRSLWEHCTMLKMKAQELFSNFLELKMKIVPCAVSFLKTKIAAQDSRSLWYNGSVGQLEQKGKHESALLRSRRHASVTLRCAGMENAT